MAALSFATVTESDPQISTVDRVLGNLFETASQIGVKFLESKLASNDKVQQPEQLFQGRGGRRNTNQNLTNDEKMADKVTISKNVLILGGVAVLIVVILLQQG